MRAVHMGEISEERFGAGKLVLLVEDNEINAEIARLQLNEIGFEVEWAENGARAVESFKNSEMFHYDLVVMDIMMPVMDGLEATQIIRSMERADARKIPIIAVTANAYSKDAEVSAKSGVSKVITKPYSRQILGDAIKELLYA